MKMKLTMREKILLAALGAIGILVGCFMLVVIPISNRVEATERIHSEKTAEYERFKAAISPDNEVYSRLRVMDNKVKNVTGLFFPSINQDKIITILDEGFTESGIDPGAIAFDNPEGGDMAIKETAAPQERNKSQNSFSKLDAAKDSYYGVRREAQRASEPQQSASGANSADFGGVERLSASISFESGYEEVAKFMAVLESNKRRIVIDNITSVRGEDETLSTTVKISFYAMPKIHLQDSDYFAWDYMNPYGKDNPFSPYSGYTKKAIAAPAAEDSKPVIVNTASPASDFGMMLSPIASDLTTVLMSKMGDSSRQTYVYGDNKKSENVRVEFVQKSGKYYYRYKTQTDSFPKNYASMQEFSPKGNTIRLDIFSSMREGPKDMSGAAITLDNKTNLKVVVNVTGDDSKNPRVKFASKTGDVQIVKKE